MPAADMPEARSFIIDKSPPGGRHDNDHINFRDIELIPTTDELDCDSAYLPLASGENQVLEEEA